MNKKARMELCKATLASVRKELAEPRMAKSVRGAEQRLAVRMMPAGGKAKLKLH
jgi:hypothetical protein